MLFRVFDRANQGYFGLMEFTDVISKRMKPNYKRIVAAERERFRMYGLDIRFPPRKKKEVETRIIYKDRKVIKEVIKEVPVPVPMEQAPAAGIPQLTYQPENKLF